MDVAGCMVCRRFRGVGWMASVWKPRQTLLNSLELVDVDCVTGALRGRGMARVYSGRAGQFDFSGQARSVGSSATTATSAPPSESVDTHGYEVENATHITWAGQPGSGLGGFDSEVRMDFGYPAYRISSRSRQIPSASQSPLRQLESETKENLRGTELEAVGIPVGGSKAIQAEWQSVLDTSDFSFEFVSIGNTGLLEGKWKNPLSEDLLDGWLIYRNWLYPLPGRLRPQGVFSISTSDVPKDLSRRLQRRKIVEDRDVSLPWDVTNRTELDRLMEMLCFHRSAGGDSYTGLHHRYWDDLDLSNLLALDRIIVFGRVATPWVEWSCRRYEEDASLADQRRLACIRWVLPVQSDKGGPN